MWGIYHLPMSTNELRFWIMHEMLKCCMYYTQFGPWHLANSNVTEYLCLPVLSMIHWFFTYQATRRKSLENHVVSAAPNLNQTADRMLMQLWAATFKVSSPSSPFQRLRKRRLLVKTSGGTWWRIILHSLPPLCVWNLWNPISRLLNWVSYKDHARVILAASKLSQRCEKLLL